MLKDYLLTSTMEESYAKKNYMSLTTEVDARKKGQIETNNYFHTLGMIPRTNTFRKIILDKKEMVTIIDTITEMNIPLIHYLMKKYLKLKKY